MANSETREIIETPISILLLGDAGCGKSTFLSGLKRVRAQHTGSSNGQIDILRDSDQPFVYDINFSKKSFTLEIYDTASPNQHWTTLRPDVVLLAFDISNRETLDGLKRWRSDIIRYFQRGEGERIPVMMVGLKRDLRAPGEGLIYPQEAYRIAQELRCDRYAECSAVTGELMAQTFEDLARLAYMTTTSDGGQSKGGCVVM
ncbi:P-loop containing nucleoside triphosphate hydrolase protein [Aspergillus pseudodeflectus]|uniref:P-loop containing nucleoside triphosphate hydrolase protein n=2 Tax=Aspergillus subgen. Nidulantes TaxID=2720870 RepID=A0ABR4KK45_9EURO|nr:Putative Rho-like small GTPase [Aspergillus calidoustus]